MPNCFTLTRKGSETPELLHNIDENICRHVGAPVDPDHWYLNWYNTIGLAIAMGFHLGSEELQEFVIDLDSGIDENLPQLWPVLMFLEENYTSNAWAHR